jgi:hypothetical protein
MGDKKNKKRKDRNSSGNDSSNVNNRKIFKQRGPSGELNVSVSDVLNQTNAVLYDENATNDDIPSDTSTFDISVFELKTNCPEVIDTMAEKPDKQPTNSDIMVCLNGICKRLDSVEKKLCTLDHLEKQVSGFEKELKSIWLAIDERAKKVEERVLHLEDKMENTDISAALLANKVDELEKSRDAARDEVTYLKSQSMRNNLIFTNIPEDNSSGNESQEVTEQKLRNHLHEALKISKEVVNELRFERVHRSPGHVLPGKKRTVVAKFTYFKDREQVRRQWRNLQGTDFQMYEQFPQEVISKRRRLIPKLKAARDEGKRAWIAYDTLFIDGRPIKD